MLAMNRRRENYEILYHQSIISVQLPILIFGQPMVQYFPLKDIEQLARRQERPAILKDLTIPLD